MKPIYLVTTGEYEDYRVAAACHTLEVAQSVVLEEGKDKPGYYLGQYPDAIGIKTIPADVLARKCIYNTYTVEIDLDGSYTVKDSDDAPEESYCGRYLTVILYATDKDAAARKAKERLAFWETFQATIEECVRKK